MKRLIMFLLAVMFAFATPSAVYAAKDVPPYTKEGLSAAFKPQELSSRITGIPIKGQIPIFQGLGDSQSDKAFADFVNGLISARYDELIGKMSDSARSVNFSYDIKSGNGIFSIVLYYNETSVLSPSMISVVNISLTDGSVLKLSDVLGPNAVSLANEFISKQISKSPESYHANFKGISDDPAFYADGDDVVLAFNKYAIAPGLAGLVEFSLPTLITCNIPKEDFYQKSTYGIRMIPLKQVVETFGMTLKWDEKQSRQIEIYRDGVMLCRMNVGVNRYLRNNVPPKTLEVAPEIVGDKTFVPISFFKEFLELHYSVLPDGSVTFSYLNDKINQSESENIDNQNQNRKLAVQTISALGAYGPRN